MYYFFHQRSYSHLASYPLIVYSINEILTRQHQFRFSIELLNSTLSSSACANYFSRSQTFFKSWFMFISLNSQKNIILNINSDPNLNKIYFQLIQCSYLLLINSYIMWGSQNVRSQQQFSNQNTGWGHPNFYHSHNSGPMFNPSQEYSILPAGDESFCLDVSQNEESKDKMLIWKNEKRVNQKFRIREFNGKYIILSLGQIVIQVPEQTTTKGVQLVASKSTDSFGQKWDIVPIKGSKDKYNIKSFCGKYLALSEGKTINGGQVIQWDETKNEDQIWRIVPC